MYKFAFLLFLLIEATFAFNLKHSSVVKAATSSTTRLFEDFNLDFKNPTIISSVETFSEKQLREFTATYSVDDRSSPLDFFLNLFKKKEEVKESGPGYASALKPTVSIAVLQEKTALFVKGKSDAKTFYDVLNAAFGPKLSSVLPEILANLPADKAAALSKIAK